MKKIYKLTNKFKYYEWGSLSFIPDFLGIAKDEKTPYAEMWMGTHRCAPSMIEENEKLINLEDKYGELPFLFKLIAVDSPLSIQVHPNEKQAIEGFQREEKKELQADDPKRCYKDRNKKNEIICALTPFTLLAGLKEECNAEIYSPHHLNLITLQPGQAVFIPCGIPHTYIKGFGMELMNSSDNVIRGGLTNKYIDLIEFKKIINHHPYLPQIITPDSESYFNYPLSEICDDFSLSMIHSDGKNLSLNQKNPAICLVTDGKLNIDNHCFKKGDSFYIENDYNELRLEGKFTLYMASFG